MREVLERLALDHRQFDTADDWSPVEQLDEIHDQAAPGRFGQWAVDDHEKVDVALRPEERAHRERPVQQHRRRVELCQPINDGLDPTAEILIGSIPTLRPS